MGKETSTLKISTEDLKMRLYMHKLRNFNESLNAIINTNTKMDSENKEVSMTPEEKIDKIKMLLNQYNEFATEFEDWVKSVGIVL